MNKVVPLEGFGGGGSSPLNFKIVGGTIEPSNPTENMIWVNTDVEITSWYFTSIQPENMLESEVWFSTGAFSEAEFNALKKDNITVYPNSAKQMVSGTLIDVTAKTYQNGEWVDWATYLYNAGNEYIDWTGGWVANLLNGTNKGDIYFTKNDTSMDITFEGGWRACALHTKNKIKIENNSKLTCKFASATISEYVNPQYHFQFGLFDNFPASPPTVVATTDMAGKTKEVTVDISNITGEYYIGFWLHASTQDQGGGWTYLTINDITQVSLT